MKRNTRGKGRAGAIEAPGKKKIPWGTIFLTAGVAAAGTYFGMKFLESRREQVDSEDDMASQRDLLLNPGMATAAAALAPAQQHAPSAVQPVVIIGDSDLAQRMTGLLH